MITVSLERMRPDEMARIVICIDCGEKREHEAKGLCKSCYLSRWREIHREHLLAYYKEYYRRNRQKCLEYAREYYISRDEEARERKRVADRRYYQKNREELLIYQREYCRELSAKIVKRVNRWRKENPERRKEHGRRYRMKYPLKAHIRKAHRRAHELSVLNTLTENESKELFVIGCGTYPNQKLHLDHFVPLSRGGGTTRANVHYIPGEVNSFKGNKLPSEVYGQLQL